MAEHFGKTQYESKQCNLRKLTEALTNSSLLVSPHFMVHCKHYHYHYHLKLFKSQRVFVAVLVWLGVLFDLGLVTTHIRCSRLYLPGGYCLCAICRQIFYLATSGKMVTLSICHTGRSWMISEYILCGVTNSSTSSFLSVAKISTLPLIISKILCFTLQDKGRLGKPQPNLSGNLALISTRCFFF